MYQVLIVDDEEIVCRGMAQFVKWEKCGFEVAGIAASVDEALRMLKKCQLTWCLQISVCRKNRGSIY
ncbi:hypothetical protein [Mediterraneibacter sp.]|uniref:hypothetical protein n=1 Tax=Mediterraneibacter sp. TaxID=2316022 RepID=UPI0039956E65